MILKKYKNKMAVLMVAMMAVGSIMVTNVRASS